MTVEANEEARTINTAVAELDTCIVDDDTRHPSARSVFSKDDVARRCCVQRIGDLVRRGGEGACEKGLEHVARGVEAVLGRVREGANDHVVEHGGVRAVHARRHDVVAEDLDERFDAALRRAIAPSGDELPEHDANREQVATTIGAAFELLGRHVSERAGHRRGLCRRNDTRTCEAEVAEPSDAVASDDHVLRRDVSVHDAERRARFVGRFVNGGEALEHVAHDRDDGS